jgi:hypothetical protein
MRHFIGIAAVCLSVQAFAGAQAPGTASGIPDLISRRGLEGGRRR